MNLHEMLRSRFASTFRKQKGENMKPIFQALILLVILGGLAACTPVEAIVTPSPTPCTGQTLTLGEISDKPGPVIEDVTPFAEWLARQAPELQPYGFSCANVVVAETVNGMISLFEEGKVDVYFDSMFPATLVREATDAQPILRRWRNCDPDYYSVIFTTPESGIRSIEDLPGHVIAMDRPDSTSGFVLPSVFLIEHGLQLIVVDKFDAPVPANKVGVYFSYDDDNTHGLMLSGKVDAGATDDFNFNKWEEETPGHLVVLGTTEATLRQAVLVRSGLGNELTSAIKDALQNAPLEVIDNVVATCKYDDIPEGIESAFAQMREFHQSYIEQIPGWKEAFDQYQALP